MAAKKTKLITPPSEGPFKLQVTVGKEKQEGWTTISTRESEGIDHVVDLMKLPWPVAKDSVDEIFCGRHFCMLDGMERLAFLDECWRILKEKGQLSIRVPARGANQALMDPLYKWPEVAEDFFYFANRPWREANDFKHYPVKCHYEWTYGFTMDADVQVRNEELQRLAVKHGRNAAHELHVCLTKEI